MRFWHGQLDCLWRSLAQPRARPPPIGIVRCDCFLGALCQQTTRWSARRRRPRGTDHLIDSQYEACRRPRPLPRQTVGPPCRAPTRTLALTFTAMSPKSHTVFHIAATTSATGFSSKTDTAPRASSGLLPAKPRDPPQQPIGISSTMATSPSGRGCVSPLSESAARPPTLVSFGVAGEQQCNGQAMQLTMRFEPNWLRTNDKDERKWQRQVSILMNGDVPPDRW